MKYPTISLDACRERVKLDRKLMELHPEKEGYFKNRINETKELIFKLVMGEYYEHSKV